MRKSNPQLMLRVTLYVQINGDKINYPGDPALSGFFRERGY